MHQCLSFSFFNQVFNENREELLILVENVSQKNIKNGKKPTLPWSPSAPTQATSIHYKNITALRQIFNLAISLYFLLLKVAEEMFQLWLSVKSINRIFLSFFFLLRKA